MPSEHASINDPRPGEAGSKVRIRRGMFRVWIVFSVLWALPLLGLSAHDWYEQVSYWYRGLQIHVTQTSCADKVLHKCFNVVGPFGAKYVVDFGDNSKINIGEVASIVQYNTDHFNSIPSGCIAERGYGCDPIFVDLSHEDWFLTGRGGPSTETELFTILAFAVPAALLAFGAAIGWVAIGFKP